MIFCMPRESGVFLHIVSWIGIVDCALDTLGSRLFHRVLEKQLELARWRLKPAAVIGEGCRVPRL